MLVALLPFYGGTLWLGTPDLKDPPIDPKPEPIDSLSSFWLCISASDCTSVLIPRPVSLLLTWKDWDLLAGYCNLTLASDMLILDCFCFLKLSIICRVVMPSPLISCICFSNFSWASFDPTLLFSLFFLTFEFIAIICFSYSSFSFYNCSSSYFYFFS